MFSSIRTDLACEARELHPELPGVSEELIEREGVSVSRITIESEESAKKLGKRCGRFITLDAPELNANPSGLAGAVSRALADELAFLLGDMPSDAPALVAGLGNRAITPDSLGPRVAQGIYVTRHIVRQMPEVMPRSVRPVSSFAPGVLGVTGIETADMLRGVVERSRPAFVIAVDSLSSRRAARISSTVQLSDAGINPGAGIGNLRNGLDEKSLGVPVIAIGVPLVVFASTIARDAIGLIADETGLHGDEEKLKELADRVIEEHIGELIVTPKDIDAIVVEMARIVSNGINMALFGKDYGEVRALIA